MSHQTPEQWAGIPLFPQTFFFQVAVVLSTADLKQGHTIYHLIIVKYPTWANCSTDHLLQSSPRRWFFPIKNLHQKDMQCVQIYTAVKATWRSMVVRCIAENISLFCPVSLGSVWVDRWLQFPHSTQLKYEFYHTDQIPLVQIPLPTAPSLHVSFSSPFPSSYSLITILASCTTQEPWVGISTPYHKHQVLIKLLLLFY